MVNDLTFRRARLNDLSVIVGLLADDPLGSKRENPTEPPDPRYVAAFAALDADSNQLLAVVEGPDGIILGCLQLSFIPGLTRLGMWRGQIEGVRIAASRRGEGLGQRMFEWAIDECRRRGCGLVQLTTDKTRPDAHRFYEALGFVASHEGMKLDLSDAG